MTRIWVGIALVLCVACQRDKQLPPGVLSEQKMVRVLTALYVAEERVNVGGVPYDSIKKIFPRFEARVFEETGIADSVFKKSFDYYMTQPERLEKLYAIVVDSLSLRAQRAEVERNVNAATK